MVTSRVGALDHILQSAPRRLWAMRWLILGAYLPVACLLLAAVIVRLVKGIPAYSFTQDALVVAGGNWFDGAISQLGLGLWAAAAGMCVLTGSVLWRGGPAHRRRALYFAAFGLVTLGVFLDDMFMLHETVVPMYLGISEEIVYLVIVVGLMVTLVAFLDVVATTEVSLLMLAGGLLAMSILTDAYIDMFAASGSPLARIFLEDAFKFAGIVAWLLYVGTSCTHVLTAAMGTTLAPR